MRQTMLNPMGGGRGREVFSSSSENYASEGEERMTTSWASEALLKYGHAMENKRYAFETREKSGIEWGILLGILVDTTAR